VFFRTETTKKEKGGGCNKKKKTLLNLFLEIIGHVATQFDFCKYYPFYGRKQEKKVF